MKISIISYQSRHWPIIRNIYKLFRYFFTMDNKNNFEYEEEVLNFWKENNIYEKVKEKNSSGELFNSVDGPPYPTGDVHLGHLRNWSIKDSVYRFRRFQGYNVYIRDGYDAHGLPVENKVQSKLNLKTVEDLKNFGEENFVKECKKYVHEIVEDMAKVRDRFGLWMDRNPYYTFHTDYISMAWQFFKKANEKGLLYKDYKTVAWCPHDETTLSDYEIKDTYKNLEDPSVYVKFKIKDEYRTTNYEESLVIWTTTPWTLQSNMAIAMNPEFNYSKVLVEIDSKKEVLVLGTSIIDQIIEKLSTQIDIKFIEILETKKGIEYEGIKYEHIYLEETPSQREFIKMDNKFIHAVVMADFVTLDEGEDVIAKLEKKKSYKHKISNENSESNSDNNENNSKSAIDIPDGTGLVHVAPGHGFDDYEVGKKYNIPIFCPINSSGHMVEGKYEGMYFKDIDPVAIKYLTNKGIMLYSTLKKHRYPCCWRCKTPIVYRAADQWWIKRSENLDGIIKENSNVTWIPESARISFNNLTKKAGDWPISRQRYWGIPLPIFEDEDGNFEVFGSKEELENKIGKKLEDIHRDDLKNLSYVNEESGKIMKPVPFIADVWFDSGCASFASHYGEGLSFEEIIDKYYPMKWITEGEDQIRGWFSSLFNVGYVVTGKAPYKTVLNYRFVMDKNGVKMSKSLGNGITGIESIKRFGADASRYYLLSKTLPEEQLNFNEEEFAVVNGFFNTLENVIRFINSYLKEHELKDTSINFKSLDVEDKWILYKLNITLRDFARYFENYRISHALKKVEEFLIKDLSKTYLKLVKDRTEERDENLLVIFNEVLRSVLIMVSVAIPFKAEQLYSQVKFVNKKESIFLENLLTEDEFIIKEVEEKGIDENFELAQDVIASVLNAREKVKIGVRWPLSQIDIIGDNIRDRLEVFEELIKKLTNILSIKYDLTDVEINYQIKPNFKTLKEDFNSDMGKLIKIINSNSNKISNDLKKGIKRDIIEGFELEYEKHIIAQMQISGDAVSSDFNGGTIILHTQQDEILLEEGYLRELIRRVQQTRKDLGFVKDDQIELSFAQSDKYFIDLVENSKEIIKKKVGAKEIKDITLNEIKEFDIKGKKLIISINKI